MKKRILWIEDEIYRIDHLVDVLEENNLEVTTASVESEWEAQLKKPDSYFDLVILDIMLPRSESANNENPSAWRRRGELLLAIIRKNWPGVPVIIFTAKPADENAERLKEIGAVEYIEKPVTVQKFEKAVLQAINQTQNRKNHE
jgi:two-component system cell cycle response regulator DivK